MTVQEQMDLSVTWEVYTGFLCNGDEPETAILKAACVMNRTHDQIKERIYGKA